MNLPIRTTPEADAQIIAIDDWWRHNRSSAPNLFLEELTRAVQVLSDAPQIGRIYRRSPIPDTRRLLLTRSRYHVYYVSKEAVVTILAVWHGQRGQEPTLHR